jgi:hypothetical protein
VKAPFRPKLTRGLDMKDLLMYRPTTTKTPRKQFEGMQSTMSVTCFVTNEGTGHFVTLESFASLQHACCVAHLHFVHLKLNRQLVKLCIEPAKSADIIQDLCAEGETWTIHSFMHACICAHTLFPYMLFVRNKDT